MKRSAERGFTLVEIMIVVAIIALLAAIAIPNVLRGRTTANETASIGNLRALVSSAEMYRSVNSIYPLTANWVANMYTTPDPDFGPPAFNKTLDLAAGSLVQGFLYRYTSAAGTTYTLESTPQTLGSTGTRAFFADDSGQIRHCTVAVQGAVATVASPTIDQAVAACP